MIKKIIQKIKEFIIENIVYAVILVCFGVYLVLDKGLSDTLNYASILLALFVPLFVVVKIYRLTESIILKERIDNEELFICVGLITITLIIFICGLNAKQRLFLGVYDGILSIMIVMVMLFKSVKNKLKQNKKSLF